MWRSQAQPTAIVSLIGIKDNRLHCAQTHTQGFYQGLSCSVRGGFVSRFLSAPGVGAFPPAPGGSTTQLSNSFGDGKKRSKHANAGALWRGGFPPPAPRPPPIEFIVTCCM